MKRIIYLLPLLLLAFTNVKAQVSTVDSLNKEFLTEPYISRSKNGSGIGLAVVKKIMQDHNGSIELENNKNQKGAKVSLLFPLN